MSIAVMCVFEPIEGMSQEAKEDIIEWLDPDLPSMILITPMQLFRGLPMHPIMIKWAGEFFVHFIYLEFHTRLLLFFSFHRRASYASNRDKYAHKALRLVNIYDIFSVSMIIFH